jgi:hypothetical protein
MDCGSFPSDFMCAGNRYSVAAGGVVMLDKTDGYMVIGAAFGFATIPNGGDI